MHNLKGLAGNLAAADLQTAAVEIEKLIKGDQLVKKILKATIEGGSSTNRLLVRMWYIRLWRSPPPKTFIIYDELPSPGADDPIETCL